MFWRKFKNDKPDLIEQQMESVLESMNTWGVDSEEYADMLTYLERLNDIKAKERPDRVSPDTMAIVAGNLLGILLIVAYEQKHVMTSKGIMQIVRPKTPTLNT